MKILIEDPSIFYTKWRNDPRPPLERWKAMPLSWSQLAKWRNSKDLWFKDYVLMNRKTFITKEMHFGSFVGDKLRTDPNFIPEIPRLEHYEYTVNVKLGKLALTGHIDNYEHPHLGEFKTGKVAWTHKKVNQHHQIDMYLALLYLSEKVKPEDVLCKLYWIPTKDSHDIDEWGTEHPIIERDGDVQVFETKRTMPEILKFLGKIVSERREMENYIIRKLSS